MWYVSKQECEEADMQHTEDVFVWLCPHMESNIKAPRIQVGCRSWRSWQIWFGFVVGGAADMLLLVNHCESGGSGFDFQRSFEGIYMISRGPDGKYCIIILTTCEYLWVHSPAQNPELKSAHYSWETNDLWLFSQAYLRIFASNPYSCHALLPVLHFLSKDGPWSSTR